MPDIFPKKRLGQHWLKDSVALEAITELAEIHHTDTVLEIGPGLGHLTHYLVNQAQHVVAVEFDETLAATLPSKVTSDKLRVIQSDILKFDLGSLPSHYKVVANIPYYLTSNLLRVFSESTNPPYMMVLLVQKEVAERICAGPGQMSILSVSVQLYYDCELGLTVPADKFEPKPKVDSQAVVLRKHGKPLFHDLDTKKFFQIVKAGFAGRRKKLRSSLSAGLGISKQGADELMVKAGINGDKRAQELGLHDWYKIYEKYEENS